MEVVKIITNIFGDPVVAGFTLLGIVCVQARKVIIKKLETKAIQDTNATNLKIAKDANRTAVKLAGKSHDQDERSTAMTKAS